MEIFGLSSLSLQRTGAGSLTVSQKFSAPLELAHRASPVYYVIPEINWGSAIQKPLWGLKENHAGVRELLEEIGQNRSPVELMQHSQNLGQQQALRKIKQQLGLTDKETNIPYGQDQPYRERWQEILWRLLQQKTGPAEQVKKINGVVDLTRLERWMRGQTMPLGGKRRMPLAEPHQLDLCSPDLSVRVLVKPDPPFATLWVREGEKPRLTQYKSRRAMLKEIERQLETGRTQDLQLASGYLEKHWQGEPIETRMLPGGHQKDLRISLSDLYSRSSLTPLRGYLKETMRAEPILDKETVRSTAPTLLPSGLTQPALAKVESRTPPAGRHICRVPENPYA